MTRFGALVAAAVDPIADARGSVAYRRHIAGVLASRALRRAAAELVVDCMRLTVDGTPHELADAHAGQSLLRVLRDVLQITSAKNACEQGECGSCTVAIDGEIACACLVLAAQADGARVETAAAVGATARCTRSSRPSCAPGPCSAASARRA